jgi:hypothetical protein
MLFINLRPTYVWALLSSVLLQIYILIIISQIIKWTYINFRCRESAWRMAVEILYVVQRNKDCNVQPDAAAMEEAGAC